VDFGTSIAKDKRSEPRFDIQITPLVATITTIAAKAFNWDTSLTFFLFARKILISGFESDGVRGFADSGGFPVSPISEKLAIQNPNSEP
jgi:hypothetical protein